MRQRRPQASIGEAAEYLFAIFDEFKPLDVSAGDAMKQARVLLDVTIDKACAAVARNALVLRARVEQKKGR